MSMVSTLAKVAAGALVARGVGKMITGGRGGGAQQGGLGGMLGGMMGGGQQGGGGLGDMLGGMMGGQQGGGRGGSIGDVLGSLGGGSAGGGTGGLGGMIGGMLGGASGSTGGGLGGLLEQLQGGASPGNVQGMPPQPQKGGLGDVLNQAFQKYGEPEQAPSQDQEAQAQLLLRAMITAAKCDGQIDDDEREKLLGHLGQDATPEEVAFVREELQRPVDLEGLVRDVPSGMEQQVYLMSLMAIDLDSQSEAKYLDGLARAMNISPQVCNAIHDKLGAPKLYS